MNTTLRTTLLSTLAATLAAQAPVTVPGTVKVADMTNREARPPLSPLSETVTLAKAAAGAKTPADLSEVAMGTLKVGTKTLAVAVGKTAADKPFVDALCIDSDGDGVFAAAERHPLEVTERKGQGNRPGGESGKPVDCTLSVGGAKLAAKAGYMRMGSNDPMLNVQFPSYLEANVKVGATDMIVAVVDKDFDGTFAGKGDMWTLGKAGDRPASPFALSMADETRFLDGKRIGITVAKDNQITVTTTPATEPEPQHAAAHRDRVEHMWAERFDKERENFVVQQKVDTARPRAAKPIAWNYVTLAQALELGKQANKPVFIDVMAFWCVWCYRMDYYTYIDAEVAKVLSEQFVPCKILQEQDLVGDYDKAMKLLDAKGIPAMGVFGTEEKPLTTIGGWKKPEAFLEELQKGLAAFAGK
jgi:hypothetical protein